MEFVTVNGNEYVQIQTLAESLGVCTATIYNWRRTGAFDFEWPLGKALTFVSRRTAEGLFRRKITDAMGAFVKTMESCELKTKLRHGPGNRRHKREWEFAYQCFMKSGHC